MSNKRNPLLSFFSSVKLTVSLLIIIAFISILGTVIPQQDAADTFIRRLSPGMISVLHNLQLFDIYHSVLFMILMVLLSINLIVCSAQRLPASWKRFRGSTTPYKEDVLEDLPPEHLIYSERTLSEEASRIEDMLKKCYRRTHRQDNEAGMYLRGEKGNASYLGVYVIHLSILVILAGMIIGFFFGFDAYTEIPEGQSTDRVVLKRGGEGLKKLNFAIQCDHFFVDYYEDGSPKVYRSDLSFIKNSSILQQSTIFVNHPATFEGIRFYQASYGTRPSDALIIVRKGPHQENALQVTAGSEFELPGKEGTVKILRMEGNLMRMGPAVKVQITSATQNVQFWIFQNIEEIEAANPGLRENVAMFNPRLFRPYDFSLAAIQPKRYTGLQVNYDPGVPVVITGAIFLIAGFMVVFFYAHYQVWIRIDCQEGKTRIRVSGKSNKDTVGINREIVRLIDEIQKTGVKSS